MLWFGLQLSKYYWLRCYYPSFLYRVDFYTTLIRVHHSCSHTLQQPIHPYQSADGTLCITSPSCGAHSCGTAHQYALCACPPIVAQQCGACPTAYAVWSLACTCTRHTPRSSGFGCTAMWAPCVGCRLGVVQRRWNLDKQRDEWEVFVVLWCT